VKTTIAILMLLVMGGCSGEQQPAEYYVCSGLSHGRVFYGVKKDQVRMVDCFVVFCKSREEARAECDRLNGEGGE